MEKPATSLFKSYSKEQDLLSERGMDYNTNDAGNSERFVDGNPNVKYVKEYGSDGWHHWDGIKYVASGKYILELGKQTVSKIYDEARDCTNSVGQACLTKWAQSSQSRSRIDDMLKLASGRMQVSVNDFDNDERLLNCRNGVIDLQTGELIKHSANQLHLKRAEASYGPGKKSAQWEKFLEEVFLGDKDLLRYVKRAIGYSALATTREHKLFIAYGGGQNGKSTMLETILEILGDYGRVAQFDAFLVSDKSANSRSLEATGTLRGARFALASETNNSRRWDEATVKRLTGGDKLRGTQLHSSSYEFTPTHHLWFMANHLPSVKDATDSFWRRPVVIPFKAKFPESTRDVKLKDKLLADRDAVLTWIVEGAQEYLEKGLGELPQVCKDAVQKYRYDNDYLSRFIEDKLTTEVGTLMPLSEAFELYQSWCSVNGITDSLQRKYFSENMEERGIIRGPRKSFGETFAGVRKKDPDFLQADAVANDNDNPEANATKTSISNFDLMRKMRA